MSEHANFILIKDGTVKYGNHRFGADLIWQFALAGRDMTVDYIESLDAFAPEDLPDDVWCEGSILVNDDTKQVAFQTFTCHYHTDDEKLLLMNDFFSNKVLRHRFNQLVAASWDGFDTKFSRDVFASSTKLCLDFDSISRTEFEVPTQKDLDNFPIKLDEIDQSFLSVFVEYEPIDMGQQMLAMLQHMQTQGKEVVHTGRGLFAPPPQILSFEAKLKQYYEILKRLYPAQFFEA